ncbi:unnamed protein product [Bursaphelenchus xylophilus]|uniref:(pine wood nematode) hypothetical protein n=1 Tax=Bursaphelenchus xylophilus TaxID=6326 RepID=A0A1I7SBW5_BURXY|nr:unnamed protein product [Bursaphelenchus xylophilus]CAG9089175.1 unnamed protein product [Bursaphelenchus xylophilus]
MEDVELRSRQRVQNPTTSTEPFVDENKGYVDHKIHASDTLQKIGLFYSVPVAEIKRSNNIIADQDIYALRYVKVPIPGLRLHYLNELHKEQTGYSLINNDGIAEPRVSTLRAPSEEPLRTINSNDKTPLIQDSDEDDRWSGSQPDSAKERIDKLLGKTDKTVAAVRSQLPPSPALEDGSRFHFVNASAPDNALKGTIFLIVGVLLMFVVIPLILTLMEERNEAELELRHQHQREHVHHAHVSST